MSGSGLKEAGQRANESDSGSGSCGSMKAGQRRRDSGSGGGSSMPVDNVALVRALARTIFTVRYCDVLYTLKCVPGYAVHHEGRYYR